MLNGVRFGAKCLAFWCKTQGEMARNARQNGAKCYPKSINMRLKSINTTLSNG